MTAGALIGYVTVPVFGVLMCIAPAITRPTLPFGVRIPLARGGAAVIQRARRAYYRQSAAVAAACTAIAIAITLQGSGPWWLSRIILLLELAADAGCVRLARRKIIAAKTSENWFAGVRRTVVADTSWRTQPQRFPVRWLIPAIGVIAATAVTGVFRYPYLPARLADGLTRLGGQPVTRSPFSAFSLVIAQLYVTGMWTGLLVLVYRSRPDIDAADPAASLPRYRRLLDRFARAALMMLALVDLTFLLAALQRWQLYRLHGPGVILLFLPAAAGVLLLIVVVIRAGRERIRTAGAGQLSDGAAGEQAAGEQAAEGQPTAAPVAGRDDDRFWKAGLFYVNRNDPAVVVPVRIGVGWTVNLGNPAAWLAIAGVITTLAGLTVIRVAAGL